MKYSLTKTCKHCKHVDSEELTKVEAAFELFDTCKFLKKSCSNCGSLYHESFTHTYPTLDKELLDMWGSNPDLYLMEQDEELLLAEYHYLPMLLEAIDESLYLKSKVNVLIEAVCIILYDNLVSPEEYSDSENKQRDKIAEKVIPELIKRKDRVLDAGNAVMGYITDVVYPQIGLKPNMQ
jgi:hypothetical protein